MIKEIVMLAKVVLILDKRREMSTKYKKLLEQSGVSVFTETDLKSGFDLLYAFDPDLIIISDSLDISLDEAAKKLRMLSYTSRPTIVAVSKSDDLKDKLAVLEAGADDYLSEPIESEEFKARINAHLRRYFENALGENTNLPGQSISFKVLKRTIKENKNWAAMLIRINEFEFYREIYGELAADKLIQTFIAIISSNLDDNDFFGELVKGDSGEGEFLVITNSLKAEHIASFVVYAFDKIVEKFYNEKDVEQGYIVLYGDDNAGKKIPLVSASIGIISNEHRTYPDLKSAISALIAVYRLAKIKSGKSGSSYVVEHPKISALDSVSEIKYNNKVMIVETDEALSLLLKTTGEMQGYDVICASEYDKVLDAVEQSMPAVIILDAGSVNTLKGLEISKLLKSDDRFKNIKIIMSTVIHDKKLILDAGTDLYLPKPYELVGMFNWVETFLKEYNTF